MRGDEDLTGVPCWAGMQRGVEGEGAGHIGECRSGKELGKMAGWNSGRRRGTHAESSWRMFLTLGRNISEAYCIYLYELVGLITFTVHFADKTINISTSIVVIHRWHENAPETDSESLKLKNFPHQSYSIHIHVSLTWKDIYVWG